MTDIATPTNRLTAIVDIVLDFLIKGIGANAAIAAAVSAEPWLGLPIVNSIFSWAVNLFASRFDLGLQKNVNAIVIRFQNDEQKDAYNQAVAAVNKPGATDAEIEAGFASIDAFINRNK